MGLTGVRCGVGVVAAVAVGALAPAAGAATVSVVNGTAVFTAAAGEANNLTVTGVPDGPAHLAFRDRASLVAGDGCTQVAAGVDCPEPEKGTLALVVRAGDGDDVVTVLDPLRSRVVTVYGQDGNDTVFVGIRIGGPTTIDGGRGNDTLSASMDDNEYPVLRGGAGQDVLTLGQTAGGTEYGGSGDDHLVYASSVLQAPLGSVLPPLRMQGDSGNDSYTFTSRFDPTTMVPGPGLDTLDEHTVGSLFGGQGIEFDLAACPRCVEVVVGSAAGDHITGDERAQAIFGGLGDDTLDGGGGSDFLSGEEGDDTIAAADGVTDGVACDGGVDTVVADGIDAVSPTCENVQRQP